MFSRWITGCLTIALAMSGVIAAGQDRRGAAVNRSARESAGETRIKSRKAASKPKSKQTEPPPVIISAIPKTRSKILQAAASAPVAEPPSAPEPDRAALERVEEPAVMPTPEPSGTPVEYAGGAVTLHELIALAEASNPILRSAEADVEAAQGDRVQASLYPNPRFETNNPEIWAGQQSFVNFGFQQDIVTKGKMRMERAAADQLVRREQASFQLDRMKMLTEVRRQYFSAVAAKHRLQVSTYIHSITRRALNAAQQLEQAGEATLTDVLLLDTEVQRAVSRREANQSLLDGELKQLAAVVGIPEMILSDVEGTLLTQPPEFEEHELRAFVAGQSALIEMTHAELIRNRALLRRAEVEPYPNIRMGPSFQTGTQPDSAQFWLSVVFDIPVWDLNQGNIRKARALANQSAANIDVARNELLARTSDLYARHRASRQVAERIRTSILPNAQKTQELVQDGYDKGQFDVNRLLQAQRNLTELAEDYIDTSEQAWSTAADLAGLMQVEAFP